MNSKHIKFVEDTKKVYNDEFTVIGEYINSNTKIELIHNTCGEYVSVYPYDFLNNKYNMCKKCKLRNDLKLRLDKLIDEKYNNEFTYDLLDATHSKDDILVTHSKCKKSYITNHTSLRVSEHCNYCTGKIPSIDYYQKRINTATNSEDFTLNTLPLDKMDSRVNVHHSKCGEEFNTNLTYLLLVNSQCPVCAKKRNREIKLKSHDDFLDEFYSIYGDTYEVVDKYQGAHIPISFKHKACGHSTLVKPVTAIHSTFACKICKQSNPELIIYNELLNNNIKFDIQYKFENCTGERSIKLPFDFALFDNDELVTIVEYDGQHHFTDEIFGTINYERVVRNDKIKTQYCKNNNINLHRIDYTKFKTLREEIMKILNLYSLV